MSFSAINLLSFLINTYLLNNFSTGKLFTFLIELIKKIDYKYGLLLIKLI